MDRSLHGPGHRWHCRSGVPDNFITGLRCEGDYHVPGKWDDYGLPAEVVDELAAKGYDLLVTVDCGTTAADEIDRARRAGLDVLVTDHHHPDDGLLKAVPCVNPRREDSEYPNEGLAGGAVAFKVGQALVQSYAPRRIEDYHRRALPLAAIATLGDHMPLTVENRAIVREGFERLSHCGLPGLTQTAAHCGVESMQDVSWSLVPLLNAAQEDESGELMLNLLLTADRDVIITVIDQLEDYRAERRHQQEAREKHLRECFEAQVNPYDEDLFVIETEEYVGGIAMSRLSEEWGCPVITYRRKKGHYTGGGRSDPDVDFLELYEDHHDLLHDYWGHPGAAGFRISATHLEEFIDEVRASIRARHDPEGLQPTLEIHSRLQPDHINKSLVDELDQLRPFGNGNPEPVFLVKPVEIHDYRLFGDGNQHCKLIPADSGSFTVIDWEGALRVEEHSFPGVFDVAGTLGMDSFEDIPAVTVSDYRAIDSGISAL